MAGASDNRRTERTPQKCFRCGSKDHIIAKCPKPKKNNEKQESKYVLIKRVLVNVTTAKNID